MIRYAIALGTTLALLWSAVSNAADLDRYQPRQYAYPAAAFSYTGLSIGAEVGLMTSNTNAHTDYNYTDPFFSFSGVSNYDMPSKSVMYGVNVRYLHQWGWVLGGAQLSAYKVNLRGSADITNCPGCGYTETLNVKADWLFTGDLILGVAWQRFALYGFGGVAGTKMEACDNFNSTFFTSSSCNTYGAVGPTFGAGISYAVLDNVFADVRYRHVDVSPFQQTVSQPPFYLAHQSLDAKAEIVSAGVSARFSAH